MIINSWRTAPVAVCLILAATGSSVHAENRGEIPVTVDYSRVDFDHPAEVEKLYRQLRSAAWQVCESEQVANQTFLESADRVCELRVLSDSVRQIDQPSLTALHDRQAAKADR